VTHTPGTMTFRTWTVDNIDELRAVGLQPVRQLTNDGQIALRIGDACIALVNCQADYKRGHGHESECAERDANAARLALCWNAHDALLAYTELEEAYANPSMDADAVFARHGYEYAKHGLRIDWLATLRKAALAQARGEAK